MATLEEICCFGAEWRWYLEQAGTDGRAVRSKQKCTARALES